MTPYWISLDLATDLLLAAAGLAVAAAGFYYLVKKLRDGQKRAEGCQMKTDERDEASELETDETDEASVLETDERNKASVLEKRLRQLEELIFEIQRENKREIEILQTALAEAESKYEKVMKSQVQVENENLDLIFNIHLLQDTLQDYKKELHAAYRKCSMSLMEYEQEKFTHSLLQTKFKKMEGTLKWSINYLNVVVAEAQRKYETLQDVNAELRDDNNDLMSAFDFEQLSELYRKCDIINNVVVAEAQRKYETLQDINAELRDENNDLISAFNSLQDTVDEANEKLSEVQRKCDIIRKERKCEMDYHSMLKLEYQEMKEFLADEESLMVQLLNKQVALVEAEKKYEQATVSHEATRTKNYELLSESDVLQDCVDELKVKIVKTRLRTKKLTEDYQKALENFNILNSECKEMLQNCEKLIQEIDHDHDAHMILINQYNQLKELSVQISQATKLQAFVQTLEEELEDTRRKCDVLTAEKEQKMVAEKFQQLQYKEMKKNCKRCYELLKKHNKDGSEDPEDP
ncbi:uveal autoantigen with coiled-coil domains and ankyrin repeats-like isoform X2 [Tachysurus fulvidraco]|uniref:uveal autoantigen with coiled-coil domains and ankyrin repeats-like isoform X2 n=1 Tax=Tachysurus fulvidraco TaxID=1234273 RepID=UPI001FEF1895|nr:uveal autoantigen with coiled-coil domains and ankyrin repeats-like isoform X2 [Tachysurus fulvidraco]